MNERGFIALPMMAWGAIAAGVVIVGLGIAVKIQSARLETSKAETVAVQGRFDVFVSQTKALGEAQAEKAKAEDVINQQRQEQTNEENKRRRDADAAIIASLRAKSANPRSSTLPPSAPTSSRPDLICLDRAEYQRENGIALERLFTAVRSLADEGAANTVDLNSAKKWAQKLKVSSFVDLHARLEMTQ